METQSQLNGIDQYTCINCGKNVDSLYKRYSPTVLKLTNCDHCHRVADQYVEYDIVIIIIDLVLLQEKAYRHILFNLKFKNFWKLSIILLVMESFSIYSRQTVTEQFNAKSDHKPILNQVNFNADDLFFYKMCIATTFRVVVFVLTIYLFTIVHERMWRNSRDISFVSLWKMTTLSSFGLFLHLPSLIWDIHKQENHLFIVSMYVSLSHLLAYTALCSCSKLWSVFVIFSASYLKTVILQLCDIAFCKLFSLSINSYLE